MRMSSSIVMVRFHTEKQLEAFSLEKLKLTGSFIFIEQRSSIHVLVSSQKRQLVCLMLIVHRKYFDLEKCNGIYRKGSGSYCKGWPFLERREMHGKGKRHLRN